VKRALIHRVAAALSVAMLCTTGALALLLLEAGVPRIAQAQEHEEGGGCGGGGGCAGGHEGGAGGMGGQGGHGQGAGAEHAMHGTRPGHSGHAAGTHGAGSEGGHASSAHGAEDRRFGGGSGTGTLDAVPEGPGQPGGTGAQALRYWGGWSIPLDEGASVVFAESTPAGAGGGGSPQALSLSGPDRCDDLGAKVSAAKRIAGRNLQRINEVHALVVKPGVAPETVAPFLLANFQEELEKGDRDLQLAGVYLGTAAGRPVTPALVQRAGALLCVGVDARAAQAIAAAAEEQRLGKSPVRIGATAQAQP